MTRPVHFQLWQQKVTELIIKLLRLKEKQAQIAFEMSGRWQWSQKLFKGIDDIRLSRKVEGTAGSE